MVLGPFAQGGIFDDTNAINAAAVAATNEFCHPVGVVSGLKDGVWYVASTGTLIESNIVMCAAHQLPSGYYSAVRFTLRNPLDNSIVVREYADWWSCHPNYAGLEYVKREKDVALFHLTNAITAINPAKRYRGQDVCGTPVVTVGFGDPAVAGSTNPHFYDGVKRVGTNVTRWFGSYANYWWTDDFICTEFNPGTWQGFYHDSGGPWFVNVNGEMQVAAITAMVYPAYSREYGAVTGATRVSVVNGWIDRVISSFYPVLTVVRVDASRVKISWPSPTPGFVLQQSADPSATTSWEAVSVAPSDDGTNKSVIVTAAARSQFWRLFK